MALFVSRAARRRLQPGAEIFDASGRAAVGAQSRARALSERMRVVGELEEPPRPAPGAASVAALDRLAGALDRLIDLHGLRSGQDLFDQALRELYRRFGEEPVDALLNRFAEEFGLPPAPPAHGEKAAAGTPSSVRVIHLRSLLLFWVVDGNPAARPVNAFLHESQIRAEPLFGPLVAQLRAFFSSRPGDGDAAGTDLVELLLEPQRLESGSLAAQLRFLLRRWALELEGVSEELLRGVDLLEEEERPRFAPGPGPQEVPSYDELPADVRSFSPDRDWMPRLVLLAKNAYVWLGQLSRHHGHSIERLDQIPDEVIDSLAESGFTGLWLIGLWERSEASARIKRLCGNPEAVGSAYSLKRYRIAEELGGEEALEALAERARQRGIRLAADMVPNHMGIDSDWVLRHPEWFVGLDESPFPNYTFDGPDLSPDPDVGIYLEDGYYDRSDAAVVFQRLDRRTGAVRYLYHGNDGTGTAWNDTAQLDFLNPRVRQAVSDTILEVAKRFPVIRFDAAMTLTRHHYQRLWYPPPGEGGAIPTRAENGIPASQFDAAMPEEFWRQVVDRAAREAPDTLLLAEAFWLLEGYFVRSLGMHRVYNSAFMNMLRDGETAKYRRLIRETVAFDPEILQRYVNFMSNPDERTARDQFGDDGRYFGVCSVLATLPGLPMFAHGQLEGLREKYGMEYKQAYWDESPDHRLIARHEREIVPLLKRRRRFAGAARFRLFDFETGSGSVDEDVLAFSNGDRDGHELVVFNNRYGETRGRLRASAPFLGPDDVERVEKLSEALGLAAEGEARLVRFRDQVAGLDYLARLDELRHEGLELRLGAYETRVLTDFSALNVAADGSLATLAERIGSSGVPSIEGALRQMQLAPLHDGLARALDENVTRPVLEGDPESLARPTDDALLEALERGWVELAGGAASWLGRPQEPVIDEESSGRLVALAALPASAHGLTGSQRSAARAAGERLTRALDRGPELLLGLFVQICLAGVARWAPQTPKRPYDEWGLGSPLTDRLTSAGVEAEAARRLVAGLALGWRWGWGLTPRRPGNDEAARLVARCSSDLEGRAVLGVHDYQGREWIVRENLELLLDLLLALEATAWFRAAGDEARGRLAALQEWAGVVETIESEAGNVGYDLGRLATALAGPSRRAAVDGEIESGGSVEPDEGSADEAAVEPDEEAADAGSPPLDEESPPPDDELPPPDED